MDEMQSKFGQYRIVCDTDLDSELFNYVAVSGSFPRLADLGVRQRAAASAGAESEWSAGFR